MCISSYIEIVSAVTFWAQSSGSVEVCFCYNTVVLYYRQGRIFAVPGF